MESSQPVHVIIPVYGAADSLARCLSSLRNHPGGIPSRIVVVMDGPQPSDVEEAVAEHLLHASSSTVIKRRAVRGGFAAAANSGIDVGVGDVCVLNSDTEVTHHWLRTLWEASTSAADIGTVTPLTNSGTLCSVPESFMENLLPSGFSPDDLASALADTGPPEHLELPTGVGFCLYITRRLLGAVGGFNIQRFGLGYGEEVDLCLRGRRAGFRNIVADTTFVFHAGRQSFGSEGRLREAAADRRLGRPYRAAVARHMHQDPLKLRRTLLVEVLRRRWSLPEWEQPDRRMRVMHVVHGWPPFDHGGCESYARTLAVHQAERHRVSAYARTAFAGRPTGTAVAYLDRGVRVRLVNNHFDQRNPLARNSLVNRTIASQFRGFLEDEKPDVVHVHHLAGHGANLLTTAARAGIPVVYQVQDWWAACSRSNLGRVDGSLCFGPSPARCAACLPLTGLHPRRTLNTLLYSVRATLLRRALRIPAAFVMGSESIYRWYRDEGLLPPGAETRVLDYGTDCRHADEAECAGPRHAAEPLKRLPIQVGVVGAVMPHKGIHVAVEAVSRLPIDQIHLHVWGRMDSAHSYSEDLRSRAAENVRFHGPFAESEKSAIFGALDVLLIPSTALESYAIVAREAMLHGIPVVASFLGALRELDLEVLECGAFFPAGDTEALRHTLQRLIDDEETLMQWRSNLPPVPRFGSHVQSIEALYRALVHSR